MAADLVTIIETVAVTQFLTPASKNLGEVVLERGKQIAGKALAYLVAVGRQPQSVAEKLLVPIALGAGLETDPALTKLWAALLANAADPAQHAPVLPGFADILRQLTPLDAHILHAVAAISQGHELAKRPFMYAQATRIQREVGQGDGVPTPAFLVAVDTLLRLRLCEGRGITRPPGDLSELIGGHHLVLAQGPGKERLAVTDLGLAFLAAVTPPTP